MGAKGSGGARVGSGRKPKSADQHVFEGTARAEHKAVAGKPLPVEFVHEPSELTRDASEVWREIAPKAMEARTLTAATAGDMVDLCELIVDMRSIRVARREAGWTDAGLTLSRELRGLVQRVEAKRRGFRLAPIGKEMADATPAVTDPWAEFDGAGLQ